MSPVGLFYDFFSRSYKILKYRQFFSVGRIFSMKNCRQFKLLQVCKKISYNNLSGFILKHEASTFTSLKKLLLSFPTMFLHHFETHGVGEVFFFLKISRIQTSLWIRIFFETKSSIVFKVSPLQRSESLLCNKICSFPNDLFPRSYKSSKYLLLEKSSNLNFVRKEEKPFWKLSLSQFFSKPFEHKLNKDYLCPEKNSSNSQRNPPRVYHRAGSFFANLQWTCSDSKSNRRNFSSSFV